MKSLVIGTTSEREEVFYLSDADDCDAIYGKVDEAMYLEEPIRIAVPGIGKKGSFWSNEIAYVVLVDVDVQTHLDAIVERISNSAREHESGSLN